MEMVFFPASTLKHQFAASACRQLNPWTQLWTMKRYVANVAREVLFMEKQCAIPAILDSKGNKRLTLTQEAQNDSHMRNPFSCLNIPDLFRIMMVSI